MYEKFNIFLVISSSGNIIQDLGHVLTDGEKYFDDLFGIEHIFSLENHEIKPINSYNLFDVNNAIIIDHDCLGFAMNLYNGIEISKFSSNKNDSELAYLAAFLDLIESQQSIYEFLKEIRNQSLLP